MALEIIPAPNFVGPAGSNGGIDLAISGNTSGVLSTITSGTAVLVGGTNITLSQNGQSITISASGGGGGASFTLNGTTDSVSISAGAGIGIGQAGSTITISASAPTNFSLNGTSSSVTLIGGNNITLTTGASSITISAANSGTVISAVQISGNTSGTSSLISSGTVYLQAVSNIGLSQSTTTGTGSTTSNVISIFGPTYVAGGIIGVSTTGGSISYSASQSVQTHSLTALGNTTSSSSGSFNTLLNFSGAGIASVGVGAGSVTISVPSPAVQTSSISLTALGNTTSSSSGTFSNLLNISGAGIVSVGAGAGSITISATTPSVTNYSTITGTMTGNTLGAASTTVTIGNNFSLSGAGIVSVGASGNTVTISASSAASANVVSSLNGSTGAMSISAGAGIGIGNAANTITISASNQTSSLSYVAALGTAGATSTGTIVLVAGANITLNTGASSITIVGAAGGAAGTQSISVGGTSVTGTAVSLALVAGTNISLATASGAGSITGTIQVTGLNSLSKVSFTQNIPSELVGGAIVTKSGTITGAAGIGSSLFLQRQFIPAAMTLSELDICMGIAFPATSQGAGTMSQQFVLYSFGNSTSLASVMSVSTTFAWTTGTSTAGASSSLTQFQGGWSVNKLHPMTFATTSTTGGEYVVGLLQDFAQGSSTWTLSLFGALASLSTNASITAFSAAPVAANAMSSGGLAAVSAFTGTTNITMNSEALHAGSALTALTQNATNNVSWFVSRATSAVTSVASATSSFTFIEAPFVGSLGTTAGSIITGTTAATALSAAGYSAGSFIGTTGSVAALSNSNTTQVIALAPTMPNFVYIGTASTTATVPTVFVAGIMSTGAIPAAITLTSTVVTYSGTPANAQPYFALVGS